MTKVTSLRRTMKMNLFFQAFQKGFARRRQALVFFICMEYRDIYRFLVS